MSKATFADFKPQLYEFEVEAPDGGTLEFSMRALTPAELLEIDLNHPRPQPRVVDFEPPGKKGGEPTPIYENEDKAKQEQRDEWRRKINAWLQEHRNRQILAALDMDVPGETPEEQIEALSTLGTWAIAAFSRALDLIVSTSTEALKARSFRTD